MTSAIHDVTGHYVDVEVAGTTYEIYYTENGTGIPLVAVHTAGAHNHQWHHFIRDPEVISKYRVIALDFPYHGKSDPPRDVEWWKEEYKLTYAFEQELILKFNEALGLVRPVFIGVSMGGIMALHLALDNPRDFGGFVALEAMEKTPDFFIDWWMHPLVDGSTASPSVFDGILAPMTPEADRRQFMFEMSQAATGIMKGSVYSWSKEHDMRETVHLIDTTIAPLYMLTGEYDYLATPAASKATADKIAGVKFQVMKGLGHFPQSEDYATFRSYVVPILNEIASTYAERTAVEHAAV